jgi:hypothetical protein
MLDEMTPEEFTEWWAYWSLEPFGPDEEWTQTAMICATTYNASGYAKKAAAVEDFMPEYKFGEEQAKQVTDSDTQQQLLERMFGAK